MPLRYNCPPCSKVETGEGSLAHPMRQSRVSATSPLRPFTESYFSLLRYSNGGEGPLPVHPLWLCLHPAEQVIENAREGIFSFPGMFVIGSNGAGEAIAFDLRGTGSPPLVHFDMIDPEESVLTIALTFDIALTLIGREA